MTHPPIRVGQTWERKGTGRHVRITYVDGPNQHVGLAPLGHGRRSACKTSTLLRDYRIIDAPSIGDWP